jgi:hypothetical protein
LATPEQLAAEHLLLKLRSDPAIKQETDKARAALLSDPAAATDEGRQRLAAAVDEWETALILREIGADPAHPRILWDLDNTPHEWFGYQVPGSHASSDNPDHIYRSVFLDGTGRYEISGRVLAPAPAQFSFELGRAEAGQSPPPQGQSRTHADLGSQLGMLTNRDIKVEPDGSFRLLIDSDTATTQSNHLRAPEGPLRLTIRDVLSDWKQRPLRLQIHRLDAVQAPPLSAEKVKERVLADLGSYVKFWTDFNHTWLGGKLQSNDIVAPFPRDGGWGYLAAGRYDLDADQVLLITTRRLGADYTGIHIEDVWKRTEDSRRYQVSLNTAQATISPDGTVTYAIAAQDPGLANWLDTTGTQHGYAVLRWQGFAPGDKPDGLLVGVRVVRQADLSLPEFASLPRVTPNQRSLQLALRAQQYTNRTRL